jgi:4a-hydroxytetrahydrobiopterin dehydratase
VPPLRSDDLTKRFLQLGNDWRLVEEHHIEKEFQFRNFRDALAFTTRVGALAEEQGHHPDIYLTWGRVRIQTWTHKSNGLTESDFVLAAHIDGLST